MTSSPYPLDPNYVIDKFAEMEQSVLEIYSYCVFNSSSQLPQEYINGEVQKQIIFLEEQLQLTLVKTAGRSLTTFTTALQIANNYLETHPL